MNDWKGVPVRIEVRMGWAELVALIDTYLDTDTMSNLFDQYDPTLYQFEIISFDEAEDADYTV